jgi:hypothetical protein
MRIESVTAHGFGPLTGRTLGLAPALTVITGDNESGKSSWHAAIFAALCGRRRGRGRPTADEQQFSDAHQPWDGGPWAVSCVLTLDDGRQIELRQDLSGRVDCRASDVTLSRDVSAEIMVEGSPDASAWLGLTRLSFRATACVGQAEVLRVLDAADGLQHSLQQAASTAGASGTAAAAIDQLESCRRSAVGRDTASAVRPLRRARDAVAVARDRLAAAGQARERFAELAERGAVLAAEMEAARLQAEAAAVDAAALASALRSAERRAAQQEMPVPVPRVRPTAARAGTRFPRWVPGAALIASAVALLAAAAVLGSVALAGLAAAVAVAVGGWLVAARRRPAEAGAVDRPAAAASAPNAHSPPAGREPAELRLESAERQALAESARRRHHEAALRLSRVDAVRIERGSALPSSAEAEEALAAAQRELARVQELDETLGLAIGFLRRAQEQVHREVVPELTGLLRTWLPQLTDGRYLDARMDPASLAVEVCGPTREFRRAQLLSHGTAEQVYLLLRVALAARLTAGHDTCPLLLDDVTVHADTGRTRQLLELLHQLSGERQIVLFAHQDQVREWALERLDGERDALVVLGGARAG